jgi:ATP-dependent Lhr-like helicase
VHERVVALSQELGFKNPTSIQEKAWPVILRKKNCLISAPTGSGKTEAAVLPVMVMLANDPQNKKGVRALYVTPLRALNRDLVTRLREYGAKLGLEVEIRHGDTTNYIRRRTLLKPPDLLVTTPETLGVLLSSRLFKAHLASVEYVIVDELHELLGNKRGSQLVLYLARLKRLSEHPIVSIGISATLGNFNSAKEYFVGGSQCAIIVDRSVREYQVDVVMVDGGLEGVAKYIQDDMVNRRTRSALIFCNTRDSAEILGAMLKNQNRIKVEVHHGSLSKESREEVESMLKSGMLDAVVCTSSLELGIDVGKIDHVYQVDSPRQVAKLVQRVGRGSHTSYSIASGTIVCKSIDDYIESCALANLLKKGKFESVVQPYAPLDVFSVVIVALCMEKGGVTTQDVFELAKSAPQFKNVSIAEIEECIDLLDKNGLVYRVGSVVKPRRKAFNFVYSNISTIPEVESYDVKELVTAKKLGRLDEKFVAENLEEGQRIILRGDAWRIISINDLDATIFVEKAESLSGATPVWTGEMIPVEKFVAREVGELRKSLLTSKYDKVSKCLIQTKEVLGIVPNQRTLLIESKQNGLVIHTCLGTKINNAFQLLILGVCRAKTGTTPKVASDPYRVFVLGAAGLSASELVQSIKSIDCEVVLGSELVLTRSFQYSLWQIAKRFGAVLKEAKYDKKVAELIARRYSGTVIVNEAMKEMLYKKYDLVGLKETLESVKAGIIDIVIKDVESYSPLANMIVYDQVLLSIGDHEAGIRALRDSVIRRHAKLVCLSCAKWERVYDVFDTPARPHCPICKSKIIAITYPQDEALVKLVKRKLKGIQLDPSENIRFKRAWKSSSLYMAFGRRAAIALACYGVGEDVAARILRQAMTEEELFSRLYMAQRNFVLYRKFWSN